MEKVRLQDVMNLVEYEKAREAMRARVIEVKSSRRLAVGDNLTLLFENRETVLFQIQEMVRTERIVDEARLQEEVDVYNQLVPGPGELSATLFIEIPELVRMTQEKVRETVNRFQGLDREGVWLVVGKARIPAQFEGGHSKEEKMAAVHYVRFAVPPGARRALADPAADVRVVVAHPNYAAEALVPPAMRRELLEDLRCAGRLGRGAALSSIVDASSTAARLLMPSRTFAFLASISGRFGSQVKESVLSVQDYTLLSWRALLAIGTAPRYPREIVAQMDSLGVGSLSIVILTGMFTGMVLTLQSAASLDAFGARPYVGRLVSVSMVRELGPVLTALMVTGRVGSGMAAELGSMVVTQQIDALRVLGSDPIRKLVAPRLAAGMIMVPILTIISDTLGIFGGSLISIFNLKLSWEFYWRSVANSLVMNDLAMGLLKPVVFGFILASVGCHMGLRTSGGTQGVGESTTRSVVVASVLILSSDFFMTKMLLVLFPVT